MPQSSRIKNKIQVRSNHDTPSPYRCYIFRHLGRSRASYCGSRGGRW